VEIMDPVLIHLYRLSGYPLPDYLFGTFLLALLCVVVGELTISVVFKVNRSHLDHLNSRVEKMERLTGDALRAGDRASYNACNKEGNDAFGQLFFNKFGLSAASLFPVFFALAWMQERFAEIALPLPFFDWEINYVFFFLLNYIPARILFDRLKRRLPYFRGMHRTLLAYEKKDPGVGGV
jgi:hypothetical protein